MTKTTFLAALKRSLPEDHWSWVIPALRQDAAVWESLQTEFGSLAQETAGSDPRGYTPAALALLALGRSTTAVTLQEMPMQPGVQEAIAASSASNATEEQPASTEETASAPENPALLLPAVKTLAHAGLLALQCREKRRANGTWEDLPREIAGLSPTVLACLYGILPDPVEMLQVLIFTDTKNGIGSALHALLSNPLAPAEHTAVLSQIARELSLEKRLNLLRALSGNRPDLAASLALVLLEMEGDTRVQNPPTDDQHDRIDQLAHLLRSAEYNTRACQTTQAMKAWSASASAARHIQAQLSAQLAHTAMQKHDIQAALAAWEAAFHLDPSVPEHAAGYALALLDVGRSADAQARLSETDFSCAHPWTLLANAKLAWQRGNLENADADAHRSLEILEYMAEHGSLNPSRGCTFEAELCNLLLELNRAEEATRAIDYALKYLPNDPDLLSLSARAHLAARQPQAAVDAAHLSASLAPNRLEFRLQLAQCMERSGMWAEALQERISVVQRVENPTIDERHDLAACALQAGDLDRVISLGQKMLEEDETDGLACVLLGEASARSGNKRQAFEHLMHAIHYASDNPAAWLSLARLYAHEGMLQKAIDTLQAASRAAPDLAQIQLALGEALLSNGAPSQALGALRRAADLAATQAPISGADTIWYPLQLLNSSGLSRDLTDQIGLRLGQTLFQLGHYQEASNLLETGYHRTPDDVDISRAYARSLLAQGLSRQALLPLRSLLASQPEDAEPYIDYTRCMLACKDDGLTDEELATLLPGIQRALEIDPQNARATALLAESLAMMNDLVPALEAYQKALDSDLASEPSWLARLSLGLGQVALQLGQVETALAALQEASHAAPEDESIYRHLSTVYDAAGLSAEAIQSARTARDLRPNDIETQIWFAKQALNLKDRPGLPSETIQAEAIHTLEHSTEIAPERADLWVKLGQTWLVMGKGMEAQKAFSQLAQMNLTSSQATTQELYQAARGLLKVEDPAAAAECLERAMEKSHIQYASNVPGTLEILSTLAEARSLQGKTDLALQALNQAIKIDPKQPAYHLKKAKLLVQTSGEPREIQACLETTIKLSPQDPELRHAAALMYRSLGDLPAALEHAERMMQLSVASTAMHLSARILSAELAAAMLQDLQAQKYLEYQPPAASTLPIEDLPVLQDYYCQRFDLAMQNPQGYATWEELPETIGLVSDHPRALALQALRSNAANQQKDAIELLNKSLETIENQDQAPVSTLQAQAYAALEMHVWETAFSLFEQIVTQAPREPRSHLDLARALVERAEFQRRCQSLEIILRAPGEAAISAQAQSEFDTAMQSARDLMHTHTNPAMHPAVMRWQARGQAAFQPDQENALMLASLPGNPEDTAARIACLRQIGEIGAAGVAAREFPQHPAVLLELSIALADEKPRQAMAAIHIAADVLLQADHGAHTRSERKAQAVFPEVNYLTARLFHANGNRSSDRQSAMQAINKALDLWPDEPRWNVLAAEIYLSAEQVGDPDNLQKAITHLQIAVQLEPENETPYLRLGEIYLQAGAHTQAIQTFEQAGQIAPDEIDAWTWMARAYRSAGDLETAANRAERAVTLAPNQVEPLLLRGEIALEADNPRGAHSRAQAALRIQPENPAALLLMARTLNGLERTDEALEMLERALPLSVQPLPLCIEKVRMLKRAKGNENALQAAQELADQYPEESSVMAMLAELMEGAGQDDKAIRAAQRALRSGEGDPVLPDREQAQLHFLLGRLLRRAGQLDQAVHHLSDATQIAPKMVECYLELGLANQERRQHNLAMSAFQQAMNVAPQDHRAYFLVGQALKESKDYLGAEKMLRRAAELAPEDIAIHRLLAAVVALNLVHSQRDPLRDMRMNKVA